MGPREPVESIPSGALIPGSAEDVRELEAALAEDKSIDLTSEELRRWAEDGECPDSLR
jgi:hypothetical protein